MKKITLTFPDDMKESYAVLYLPGMFNEKKTDYRALQPGSKKNANVTIFNDGNIGLFWRTETGYGLEIRKPGT